MREVFSNPAALLCLFLSRRGNGSLLCGFVREHAIFLVNSSWFCLEKVKEIPHNVFISSFEVMLLNIEMLFVGFPAPCSSFVRAFHAGRQTLTSVVVTQVTRWGR